MPIKEIEVVSPIYCLEYDKPQYDKGLITVTLVSCGVKLSEMGGPSSMMFDLVDEGEKIEHPIEMTLQRANSQPMIRNVKDYLKAKKRFEL